MYQYNGTTRIERIIIKRNDTESNKMKETKPLKRMKYCDTEILIYSQPYYGIK